MNTLTLRLNKLPAGFEALRKLARRTDGADRLDYRFTDIGFDPYANIGDTVQIDLNATGRTVASLPPGVGIVKQITLLSPVGAGPLSDLIGKPVGVPFFADPAQASAAIASGIAQAA